MYIALFLVACVWLLSGCSTVSPEAIEKYKQENILDISLHVPQQVEPGVPQVYTASLMQAGEAVLDPDEIVFHIWSDVDTAYHETLYPAQDGKGNYTAEAVLPEQGIYYFQVIAQADGSEVMPTKRFAAGDAELTIEEEVEEDHSHHAHH